MGADSRPGPGFGDRLASAVRQRESVVVVGLDPDLDRLWPGSASAGVAGDPAARAAAAVVNHCDLVLDAVASACVAVKLQSARFERLGAAGAAALATVAGRARDRGLLTILDGKRGDIDVSATAYAEALLGSTATPWGDVPGLAVDAVTAAPYMGADSLRPFVSVATRTGAGVFVLVRTSNPGAADIQDRELADGARVWERVAAIVAGLEPSAPGDGPLGSVGAVVGATAPEHLGRLRTLLPRAPFLLPGVGAQGGRVADLAPAFAPGPGGALVTASRSLVDAGLVTGEPAAPAARRAAEALRAAAANLA